MPKLSQLPVSSAQGNDLLLALRGGQDITVPASSVQVTSLYNAPFAGSAPQTLAAKFAQTVSVLDFLGADPTGAADSRAAFLAAANASAQVWVPPGTWKIGSAFAPSAAMTWLIQDGASFSGANNIPAADGQIKFGAYANTWVNGVGGGVFEYLESQSAFNVRGHIEGIGQTIAGRSSTSPAPGVGAINYAAFAYNDNTAVASGVWNYYGTALRAPGATGPTHGIELDILNTGAIAQMLPAQGGPNGLTDCLWLAAGGEFAATAAVVNPATCAIGIIQNDVSGRATFDKGIIFQNKAINGTDGASGTGIAIALATGHVIQWFNNTNNLAAYIYAAAGLTGAQGTGVLFSPGGFEVLALSDGSVQAVVAPTAAAVNHVALTGATTGNAAKITAQGTDTNIDLFLTGQGGASFVQLAAAFTAQGGAPPVTGYISFKDLTGVVRKVATIT